tara:strand:+ start:280 stop:1197 length:918 start_codon:yes stop_codon:yes gene_type:complete
MRVSKRNSILVTGAGGFVGSSLCKKLISKHYNVIASSRSKIEYSGLEDCHIIESLNGSEDWSSVLNKCSTIIHLAARAHKISKLPQDSIEIYREINTLATINLAKQAIKSGVKKFVFISTIGVNGSFTKKNKFTNFDIPSPTSFYALSKYEAEIELNKITKDSGMQLIIIRPPLVYHVLAPGNLRSFINLVKIGIPLPFASVNNRRSFVSLKNLTDLIIKSFDYYDSQSITILAGDGINLSTRELLYQIGRDLNINVRLFPFPVKLLSIILYFLGKKKMTESLFKDLRIDISHTKKSMNWTPEND